MSLLVAKKEQSAAVCQRCFSGFRVRRGFDFIN